MNIAQPGKLAEAPLIPQMLIIADDLTGAADCAVACGHGAVVLLSGWDQIVSHETVVAFDANTRSMAPENGAQTTSDLITHLLRSWNNRSERVLLFKKVDSTLRGNLAAELAATLEACRGQVRNGGPGPSRRVVAVFAPAFPARGRTTVQGRQRVHGVLLDDANLWPGEKGRPRSHLPAILGEARLSCGSIEIGLVRGGPRQLELAMGRLAADVDVIVCDAETDDDLLAIAEAAMVLDHQIVWAGSAGLARQVARQVARAAGFANSAARPFQNRAVITRAPTATLFVTGSPCNATLEQARALVAVPDIATFVIPPSILLSTRPSTGPSAEAQEYAYRISASLLRGTDVLVRLDAAEPCAPELAPRLTASLAQMLAASAPDARALVATGGETARSILDAWGIQRLRVFGEVEPGLPWSIAEGWHRLLTVLTKAGSFGTPDTLLRCRDFLQALEHDTVNPEPRNVVAIDHRADMPKPIIAITMGDAAGVGPEIIMKSLAHREVYEQCHPLVIGDAGRLNEAGRLCADEIARELQVRSLAVDELETAAFQCGVVHCIDLKLIPPGLPWGRLSPLAGDAAYQYLVVAARLALEGKVGAICTAPLNKEALQAAGHKFPGHTELLAHLTGTPEVSMMLSTPKLKVLHVTTHIGLIDAIAKIEPGLVERTIARGQSALQKSGISHPRIGVCGINPHAGENGLFGHGEEEQKIVPAIASCRERGWNVEGPLPADTLFYRAQRGDFDLVIAMYHDQGHGPVKVLGLESGVNITIGLPVVRTSVDHGTAFDIAGTGKADERSLLEAIRQAVQLAPVPATR